MSYVEARSGDQKLKGHVLLTGNTTFKLANFRESLIRTLIAENYKVTVLSPRDSYVSKIYEMGCEYVPLTLNRNTMNPFSYLLTLVQMFVEIRRTNPDIIFSYTIVNNIFAGIVCRFLGKTFVPNVTGLGPAFDKKGPFRFIISLLYRFSFRRSLIVFFQNTSDMATFLNLKLTTNQKSKLLPGSGVDLKYFDFKALPNDQEQIRFILVTRLLWKKGVGIYADVARKLKNQFPKAVFQLLGPMDGAGAGSVSQTDLDCWVKEGVLDYLGETQDVLPYLRTAHCIVLPSYYREGTPRSLLEGGAVGLPIITTDIPGCRDTVLPMKSGFLIEPKNVVALEKACVEFLELSSDERKQMGRESRAHIERQYDEKIVIAAYMELLKM